MSKKIALGFLGFASMLFYFWKRDEQKNCVRFFKICKYAFSFDYFLVRKGVIEMFGVCMYVFLIFNIKEVIGMSKIFMYAFLTWLFFSMNGVVGNVWGMGKNFEVYRYALLFIWKLQVNRVHQKYLLYASWKLLNFVTFKQF